MAALVVPVMGKQNAERQPPSQTLSDSEIRQRILNAEIRREDLSLAQRQIYSEELKKARRY